MIKLRRLRCSFCRKNENEVSKLVAGPRVLICDECVAVASRLMDGGPTDDRPHEAVSSAWNRMLSRARRLWRGGAQRARAAAAHGL